MKKLLAIILAIIMVLGLTSCGITRYLQPKKETDFTKPDNYSIVINLLINLEFNFYLDSDNNVLAVEGLDSGAKMIIDELALNGLDFYDAVKEVFSKLHDEGYIANNLSIKVTVVEIKDPTIDVEDILENTEDAIEEEAENLKTPIDIEVNAPIIEDVEEEIEDEQEQEPEEEENKEDDKNSIEGLYGCPFFTTDDVSPMFNSDGSPHFEELARYGMPLYDKYLVNKVETPACWQYDYEFPEADVYNRIKSRFVFNDTVWNNFLAYGDYNIHIAGSTTYENGVFKFSYLDGVGAGPYWIQYEYLSLQMQNGSFVVTHKAFSEEGENFTLKVTYNFNSKYNGEKYVTIKSSGDWEDGFIYGGIYSKNKDFINSIRIAKIEKLPRS